MTFGTPSLEDFAAIAPQADEPLLKEWIARGANFVACYVQAQPGARLARDARQTDEYMVFVVSGAGSIEAADSSAALATGRLAIVPPGPSELILTEPSTLFLLFSSRAADLAARAANADVYSTSAPNVAPLTAWPEPADGYRLRTYDVAAHVRPDSNMRIFRSCNLMLNIMLPRSAPRDTTKLSPHSHTDFEQGSFALLGTWKHHLRYPWGKDLGEWREDEHREVGSPSMLVIPPQVIHTSRNINEGEAWLLDIFAPPRLDFSNRPGMVCNAEDYPLPAGVATP
ncbi:hypothetical protein AVE30378_02990 [Achromobacter veterisilvae]|uniref:Uncharacterized protein n=1 Tax=Achromobacter veterisilvae TaxID=2069367 RepID=A0A446CK18_9BURK|nr:hypothetical protein [Achromobacter veterisilvae]SSW68254.1 hypothetical protein AVE30378_02990 [Achromobacter veterisilvae]